MHEMPIASKYNNIGVSRMTKTVVRAMKPDIIFGKMSRDDNEM